MAESRTRGERSQPVVVAAVGGSRRAALSGIDGLSVRTATADETPSLVEEVEPDCVVVESDATGFDLARSISERRPEASIVGVLDAGGSVDLTNAPVTDVVRSCGDWPSVLSHRVRRLVRSAADRRALRESRDKIARLHEIEAELSAAEEEGEVYRIAARAAERVLEFDQCVLTVEEGGRLHVEATSSGLPPGGAEPKSIRDGVAGLTYRTGESTLVANVRDHPEANPVKPEYRSALSVPIGEIGVFQAVSKEVGWFTDEDRELAELLTTHVAEAVGRLRSARALRAERDRFASLFETLPAPAIEVDLETERIVAANPQYEATFGYEAEAVIGTQPGDAHVPDDRLGEYEGFIERNRAGETIEAEVRRRTADGDGWFIIRAAAHSDGGVFAIYVDITDRVERERAIERLHEATRELMDAEDRESVSDRAVEAAASVLGLPHTAIHEFDREAWSLVPLAWTDRVEENLGEPPSLGPGTLAWDAFSAGETRVYDDVTDQEDVLNPETVLRSELYIPIGREGVVIASSSEVGALSDHDRHLASVLAANVEAAFSRTDREGALRERERALARQNERLEEFANIVSHDLRNPLNVASGHLELARQTGEESHLESVSAAHDRMDAIVENVLTMARTGQPLTDRRPVPVDRVVTQAWGTVATADATLDLETDLGVVSGDETRLRQLFENLFRNAVEHGGEDVTVAIEPLTGGGFAVSDDGPGIPEEERGKVFDRGFSGGCGTGFGLAIVGDVVEAHGWEIELGESDEGTRFEIRT
ncbi:GAF domain-containing protein [Natronorarus salvus]|uniref:GAF domain-containing protein n=1 Tax=Natronorarus salvus TaxID=3117733 RepID=UPI002F2661A6